MYKKRALLSLRSYRKRCNHSVQWRLRLLAIFFFFIFYIAAMSRQINDKRIVTAPAYNNDTVRASNVEKYEFNRYVRSECKSRCPNVKYIFNRCKKNHIGAEFQGTGRAEIDNAASGIRDQILKQKSLQKRNYTFIIFREQTIVDNSELFCTAPYQLFANYSKLFLYFLLVFQRSKKEKKTRIHSTE